MHKDAPGKTVQIIGRLSSINVRKVLWTAAEIGLAYDFDGDWNEPARSHRRNELLALNPNDQFPVIRDEAGVLWESNTICRYLAAKHNRTDLLPPEPRERAIVEQWMDWQGSDLCGAWRYAFLALSRRTPGFSDGQRIEASTRLWNKKMAILEARLAETNAFVAGPTFTLADIVLGLSVNRWLKTPIERPALPAVQAFFTRLQERAAFASVTDGIP
jgi:glutathione S-transferase